MNNLYFYITQICCIQNCYFDNRIRWENVNSIMLCLRCSIIHRATQLVSRQIPFLKTKQISSVPPWIFTYHLQSVQHKLISKVNKRMYHAMTLLMSSLQYRNWHQWISFILSNLFLHFLLLTTYYILHHS